MPGMTGAQYRTAMQTMLVVLDSQGQANLDVIIPRMIEYAELRIYRELDLIAAKASGTTALVPNQRGPVAIPASLIILESANVITPAATAPDSGTRNQLRPVSRAFLDATCPQGSVAPAGQIPRYYCPISDTQVLVGPSPDQNYNFEGMGMLRPALLDPIGSPGAQDFISTNLPDLLLAASMIFGAAYQKNFGATSDDPRMAVTWEALYQKEKEGAAVEEARKKAYSADWSAYSPTPYATPPRGA